MAGIVSHARITLMKSSFVPSVALFSAALAGNLLALTPIVEKFNGTDLDYNRWAPLFSGRGQFSLAKGKLSFVVPSRPTPNDYASIQLTSSQPGYNESWVIILDISQTTKAGNKAGCGIQLFNTQDRRDHLYLEFYGKAGLSGAVRVNDQNLDNGDFSLKAGAPKGSIRVKFNKNTKLLTFSASLIPASEGYDWKEVGTFSPTGKGGDVNADWEMKSSSGTFGIELYGFGISQIIEPGKVTFANFSLTGLP